MECWQWKVDFFHVCVWAQEPPQVSPGAAPTLEIGEDGISKYWPWNI